MKKYLIDLHTHTTFSDGELSPASLCEAAISKGVNVLGITDHNTTMGYQNLILNNNSYSNLRVIPGIEYEADIDHGKLHILGYGIDVYDKSLENLGRRIMKINLERFRLILESLKKNYAINFSDEEVTKLINSKLQLAKGDVALMLLKHGYVDSTLEAFNLYIKPILNDLKVKFSFPSYEEVIYSIKKAGGVSVLAHPKSLDRNFIELDYLVKKLKSLGLNGIEVYHSSHSSKQMNVYKDIANKYHLYISGGSDYHGDIVKPNIEIGTGSDNLNIKSLSILKKIK